MSDVQTEVPSGPPSADEPPEAPASGRPRRWWLVALVVGAVAVVVALVVFAGGDDDDGPASPTNTTPVPDVVTPNLDDAGAELAELLALGRDQTVHAVYRTAGGDDVTLELWRKDGKVRQDTHVEADGSTADTAGFLVDGESITCSRRDDSDWTCSQAVAETSPDGIFGSVLEQLAGVDVEARDDTIDGADVRCFTFGAADGDGEVCVTEAGTPVRAAVGDTAIELVESDGDVDDDIFDPPAEISSAE
ncbi:hypothetical protein [Actinospongicola halichondriae]|uniref:hypothetical protein n=1 Tax=Actinospongicola halichondriae TaxID=3236844 RepID=UPI003D4D3631